MAVVTVEQYDGEDVDALMWGGFIPPFHIDDFPAVQDPRLVSREKAEEIFLDTLGLIDLEGL